MRLRATTGVTALLLIANCVALSACGGNSGKSATSGSATTRSATKSKPPDHHPRRARTVKTAVRRGPRIGATQSVRVAGTTMAVTITSVIDPLRGSGAAVAPGMKAVGVLASVRNDGPGGYDGSDTSDFSLRSAAGLATPVFVPAGPCKTQVQDFMNAIGTDQLRNGCVAFSIPKDRSPVSVHFSPGGGSSGVSRSWSVPGR